MRVAISGSHSTGKTTLIAAFLRRHPDYAHEPEAFETLADDVELTESAGPTPESLRSLLEYTVSAVHGHGARQRVIFERSPVDYLAYAAASRGAWQPREVQDFLARFTPIVRASVRQLDVIAYLPVSTVGPVRRRGENRRFRRRVAVSLEHALLDDVYGLFGEGRPPQVVSLPSVPEKQLAELDRLVQTPET